jgi:hypothetical protein
MADFSESDVQSLAAKLGEFRQTLTPGEDAALTAVIHRAMPQGEDVQGYAFGPSGPGGPGSILTPIFTPFGDPPSGINPLRKEGGAGPRI